MPANLLELIDNIIESITKDDVKMGIQSSNDIIKTDNVGNIDCNGNDINGNDDELFGSNHEKRLGWYNGALVWIHQD